MTAFDVYTDLELLARAIWGEARGEPIEAQVGVGCVIRNRATHPKWWGRGWREVILKPYQFSAFNENDPNRKKMFSIPSDMAPYSLYTEDAVAFVQCKWVADGIYSGWIKDNTKGANHYHTAGIVPSWAEGVQPCRTLGKLMFYAL